MLAFGLFIVNFAKTLLSGSATRRTSGLKFRESVKTLKRPLALNCLQSKICLCFVHLIIERHHRFPIGGLLLGLALIRSAGGLGQVTTSTSIVLLVRRGNTDDRLLASPFPPISIVCVLLSPDNAIMINVDSEYST